MAECRSCGARILFVETKNGKKMPIEYDKDIDELLQDKLIPVVFDPDTMQSHFSSCPGADNHRRG